MGPLVEEISQWIARRVAAARARGAVVGLSGGIDSAVTAALCRRALGDDVLGLVMPCESDPSDAADARAVEAWLGLAVLTVRLDSAYQALCEELCDVTELTELARANIKPRLRMTVLYAMANSLDYLVVGTGNRSEIMAGYFTKYGDGGADILPIGGLLKCEVRNLARELGVPARIIDKPPTAGLWAGQTDEGEMGLAYEDLDRAIDAIEFGRAELIAPEVRVKVRGMIERSAHKRALPPVFRPGAAGRRAGVPA